MERGPVGQCALGTKKPGTGHCLRGGLTADTGLDGFTVLPGDQVLRRVPPLCVLLVASADYLGLGWVASHCFVFQWTGSWRVSCFGSWCFVLARGLSVVLLFLGMGVWLLVMAGSGP